jgi:hypothetical protein
MSAGKIKKVHSVAALVILALLSVPGAAGATDDGLVRHPLLTPAAVSIIDAHSNLSAEEIYVHLEFGIEVTEPTPGVEVVADVVRWVEPEAVEFSNVLGPTEPEVRFTADATITDWLADPAAMPSLVEVSVAFNRTLWDTMVSVQYQQALAMIRGEVATKGDLQQVREGALHKRRAAGDAAMKPTRVAIEALGAVVEEWSGSSGTGRVVVGPDALLALASDSLVLRLEHYVLIEKDDASGHSTTVTGPTVNGREVTDLVQAAPYYIAGYYGDSSEDIGIVESYDEPHNEHVSFHDGSGNRRLEIFGGTSTTACTFQTVTTGTFHVTRTASTLMSDLTLGQDSGFTNITAQRNRSGVARRASGLVMDRTPSTRVVDLMPLLDVFIINRSNTVDNQDDLCQGADTLSREWNSLFESGIALFTSEGNAYHPSASDCVVQSPGSAIGAFTVSPVEVSDNEDVWPSYASMGGNATEGEGRTVIDIAAHTNHNLRAVENAAMTPQYDSGGFNGSSGATPVITGAASLFREFYANTYGSGIDDPARLYVNLLLMGDGMSDLDATPPDYNHAGYSGRLGAGILRLRSFDSAGLDAPAQWKTGSTCVGDSLAVNVDLNGGNVLPAGVDYIKATTWWYDHGHDNSPGAGHDKYTLQLQRLNGSIWTNYRTDASEDNKQRVFYDSVASPPGSGEWRLRITGADVSSDGEGCGTNSNRVHWAVLFEENDRDDDATLNTYVRPEPED